MPLPKLHSVRSVPGLYRTTTKHTPTSVYYARVQIVVDPKARDAKQRKRSWTRRLGLFSSAESAAEALRCLRRELRARYGKGAPPAPSTVRTLRDAQRAQLIERAPRLRPSTIANYKRENANALAFFGYRWTLTPHTPETAEEKANRDCLLTDLTRKRIEEWIRFRLDTVSAATVNRDLARLRAVLRWAEREGWLEGGNPIHQIHQLRETEGVLRWLAEDEEQRLKAASPDWLWRMILFSIWTGLRRGEQLGLRWTQIRDGMIEVSAADAKGKRSRWVPFGETVAGVLEQQRQAANAHPTWVFPNQGGTNRWNPFNLYKAWDKARRAAGLQDYRWHDNRHTFCSRLVQEGVKLEKIQVLAGHRDFKMTQRYAHLDPTHLRAPIDALEARRRRIELLRMVESASPAQE